MSKPSARSKASSKGSEKREKSYKLYVVHFHGTGLDPLREQFIALVKNGLRRNVFVIDLDEELKKLRDLSLNKRTKSKPEVSQSGDLVPMTLNAIEQRRQLFESINRTIEAEKKFDLFHYWLEQMAAAEAASKTMPKTIAGSKKTLDKIPEKVEKGKNRKSSRLPIVKEVEAIKIICPVINPRIHNKVGKGVPLSKRKYIEDDPQNAKLFIVLVGSNVSKTYLDLLSRNEPLQAIIHFIPELCAYDYLIPLPRNEDFLRQTLQEIKGSIDTLRRLKLTKPVGMFQQQLPVISRCLAEKYANMIFNELTWYLYDLEILYQQYQLYYVAAFHEANVEMDKNVNVEDLLEVAKSLSIQGHFLKTPLPAAATDIASVVMFLEGLISIVAMPDELLSELDTVLISYPLSASILILQGEQVTKLLNAYRNAFKSITQIRHFARIAVERNNELLHSLISYMNINQFSNIYHCCLEYNILRRYVISKHVTKCVVPNPPEQELEPFYLPQYCKLFLTEDGILQRLTELLTRYDNFDVNIMHPGCTLYHFKLKYNEVIQVQKRFVIPTRLCFRDFTIFELEEFLKVFVSAEERADITEARKSKDARASVKQPQYSFSMDIFIRPLSLKARKLQVQPEINVRPVIKRKTLHFESEKHEAYQDYVGLPSNHRLLYGYNLENILQEIFINLSTYDFEEGCLKLYEDRWCFDDLNKTVFLSINECSTSLCRPRHGSGIARNVLIRTKNEVTCRVYNEEEECALIVLNYPNGLSIYYHGDYAEQLWSVQETFELEERRTLIPEGAVVVHYHMADVIRVLRYNGEVYELFQYELASEEEEEEHGFYAYGQTSVDPTSQVSEKDVPPNLATSKTTSAVKAEQGLAKKKKLKSILKSSKEDPIEEATSAIKMEYPKTIKEILIESIENELRFLNYVAEKYGLSYLHMQVTTTIGRVLILTHTGVIFEKNSIENLEWHDYYANEAYAMRDDGVKRIWTHDSLKCFHKNGTIITTRLDESLESMDWDENIGAEIFIDNTQMDGHGSIDYAGDAYRV